jgi:hypothetical protein
MRNLQLTVTDNDASLSGLSSHVFVSVSIQDTSNGKSQKLTLQANAYGTVEFHIPMFDHSKSISVTPLVPGETVHDMIFEKSEDPRVFVLRDSHPTEVFVTPTAPPAAQESSDVASAGG